MDYARAHQMLRSFVRETHNCTAKHKVDLILDRAALYQSFSLDEKEKHIQYADTMFRCLTLEQNVSSAYAKEMYEAALTIIERV